MTWPTAVGIITLEQLRAGLYERFAGPMKRPGRGEEAAELFAFLASTGASYLNGARIPLDGGLLPTLWFNPLRGFAPARPTVPDRSAADNTTFRDGCRGRSRRGWAAGRGKIEAAEVSLCLWSGGAWRSGFVDGRRTGRRVRD